MSKKCCFTGYRPSKLPYLKDEQSEEYQKLYRLLTEAVREAAEAGYDYFISGFAQGIDLMAAEIVIALRRDGWEIELEAALPAPNQTNGWDDFDRGIYYMLLDRADRRICLDRKMTRYSALKRNEYMIQEADLVIAVFDGRKGGTAHTVGLARKKKRKLWLIDPNDFTITKEEGLF